MNKGIIWTVNGPVAASETLPDNASTIVHDAMSRSSCEEFFDDWIDVMLALPVKAMGKYCQKMCTVPSESFTEFQKRHAFGFNYDGTRKEDPKWPEGSLLNPFNSVNHPIIEKYSLENPQVRQLLSNVDLHRSAEMNLGMLAHMSLQMR